ncbi:MAG: hypothetical protein HRU19_05945 [Pseudobacteriovorax sp.]|nr:hypothetical protein [Pseudobacteriovorax sp.]
MRFTTSIVTMSLALTMGCQSDDSDSNDNDSPSNPPADLKLIESFSAGQVFETSAVIYKAGVDGWIHDNRYHWDDAAGFSYLQFQVSYHDLTTEDTNLSEEPLIFTAGRPLKFESSDVALTTPFNIDSLGLNFDTAEAPILLQYKGNQVQVGKFRPVENGEDTDDQLGKLKTPELCEGAYAKVCSIAINLDESDPETPVFRLSMTLKDGETVNASINFKGYYSSTYYHSE